MSRDRVSAAIASLSLRPQPASTPAPTSTIRIRRIMPPLTGRCVYGQVTTAHRPCAQTKSSLQLAPEKLRREALEPSRHPAEFSRGQEDAHETQQDAADALHPGEKAAEPLEPVEKGLG